MTLPLFHWPPEMSGVVILVLVISITTSTNTILEDFHNKTELKVCCIVDKVFFIDCPGAVIKMSRKIYLIYNSITIIVENNSSICLNFCVFLNLK